MTISDADFERLSAAFDGRLDFAAQQKLDADLAADPALQAAWEDLQATVGLLRDLPPLVPPRSFTLDPAVYGPARSRRGFWNLRWLAPVGMLALFIMVGGFLSTLGSSKTTIAGDERIMGSSAGAPMAADTGSAAGGAMPESQSLQATMDLAAELPGTLEPTEDMAVIAEATMEPVAEATAAFDPNGDSAAVPTGQPSTQAPMDAPPPTHRPLPTKPSVAVALPTPSPLATRPPGQARATTSANDVDQMPPAPAVPPAEPAQMRPTEVAAPSASPLVLPAPDAALAAGNAAATDAPFMHTLPPGELDVPDTMVDQRMLTDTQAYRDAPADDFALKVASPEPAPFPWGTALAIGTGVALLVLVAGWMWWRSRR